jgi:Lon protease-like protein
VSAHTLPLFPLPVVLFPGVALPLHIFEPRYRQMLADCLSGDRRFGLIYRPADVPERALPPGHVGCVARLTRVDPLPDGRANVIVEGEGRFALRAFIESAHPYHVAEIDEIIDASEASVELEPVAQSVRDLFARMARAAGVLANDSSPAPSLSDDPRQLSFDVAASLDLDVASRQALLGTCSPATRLRDVERVLRREIVPIEQRAAVHVRARSNGHGASTPH